MRTDLKLTHHLVVDAIGEELGQLCAVYYTRSGRTRWAGYDDTGREIIDDDGAITWWDRSEAIDALIDQTDTVRAPVELPVRVTRMI